jgi:integrase
MPKHYLLPEDLSRHTKAFDPLKGGVGYDATRHQKGWRSAWRRLCKSADLSGLRFHDLRHTFITMMAKRNVPLPVVQAMLGHMSAKTTRHYTHISSGDARQAVELLNRPAFVEGNPATEKNCWQLVELMVGSAGLEPATSCL